MALLNEYIQYEQQLQDLQEKMERLKNDSRLQDELKFKDKLEKLMHDFDKTTAEVVQLLAPSAPPSAEPGRQRQKRRLKTYKNPFTGEVVETRGGNHKQLKGWRDEHGAGTVEEWLVSIED